MKDGSTHLAHKAEYSVDLDTGAIVAVTLQGADQGDTTTLWKTVEESVENLRSVADGPQAPQRLQGDLMCQVVGDKGYHSNDTLRDLREGEVRTYISEPDRGRRSWIDDDTGEPLLPSRPRCTPTADASVTNMASRSCGNAENWWNARSRTVTRLGRCAARIYEGIPTFSSDC